MYEDLDRLIKFIIEEYYKQDYTKWERENKGGVL